MDRSITVSLVSHGQNGLVNRVLKDLQAYCADRVELVVTENIGDATPLELGALHYPVRTLRNKFPRGFGANHNAAFTLCASPYFCVLNPDVRIPSDLFGLLLEAFEAEQVAVVGPQVRTSRGSVEDNARFFPTPGGIARKLFRRPVGPDYPVDRGCISVDWLAGMFLVFRSSAFRAVGGFDERYFLYYEDADICRRLKQAGLQSRYEPRAVIIHDAQRASRRQPWLACHHLRSALRFFVTRP